jgi:hypothetical protein
MENKSHVPNHQPVILCYKPIPQPGPAPSVGPRGLRGLARIEALLLVVPSGVKTSIADVGWDPEQSPKLSEVMGLSQNGWFMIEKNNENPTSRNG